MFNAFTKITNISSHIWLFCATPQQSWKKWYFLFFQMFLTKCAKSLFLCRFFVFNFFRLHLNFSNFFTKFQLFRDWPFQLPNIFWIRLITPFVLLLHIFCAWLSIYYTYTFLRQIFQFFLSEFSPRKVGNRDPWNPFFPTMRLKR